MSFQLSEETLSVVEAVIPKYPHKRSAIMMILHAIQKEQGYISLAAQEWVAEKLDLNPIQVREVVTFYPFYREHPIGKRHIRVCRTLSCALNGSYKICDKFKESFETNLDEISPDGRVTVEFAECLASCGSGPVALVDNELHENLTEESVQAICEQIKKETPAEAIIEAEEEN